MPVFETFEIELQNTLNNLFNPAYKPAGIIFEVIGLEPSQGLEGARSAIIQSIREMNDPDSLPLGSKGDFIYQLLDRRFLQSQSQEAASEILNISTRHFRRKQHEAIHALALRLWDKNLQSAIPAREGALEGDAEISRIDAIAHEIQVLTNSSPGITTNLESVLHKAVEIASYMEKERNLQIVIRSIPEELAIPIHPSVLRQIVLYVVLRAVQAGLPGKIEIDAQDGDQIIILSFFCPGFSSPNFQIPDLVELLPALSGKAELDVSSGGWKLSLVFPKTRRVKILAIDDNLDQVYLFRRLLSATAYELTHLPGGDDLMEFIIANRPDVILMDILMPGIDGWDLLMQIRKNPSTSTIPVVISSVMGNESMARSLGANGYLSKPVDRKILLQVLDQAIRPRVSSLPDSPS